MSEKLEQKTIELMDLATDAGKTLATKLDTLAQQYGGDVWDVALWAARIDAASTLFEGVAWLVVSILLWVWLRTHLIKLANDVKDNDSAGFLKFLGGFFVPICSFLTAVVGVVCVVNLWAWAGLIYPQVWIAKKVLGL